MDEFINTILTRVSSFDIVVIFFGYMIYRTVTMKKDNYNIATVKISIIAFSLLGLASIAVRVILTIYT